MAFPYACFNLIELHEHKMQEFQQLHNEIPKLENALVTEPNNEAIKRRLKICKDTTSDISYLTTGPELIVQYTNAESDKEKDEIVKNFYLTALKEPLPPLPKEEQPTTRKRKKRPSDSLEFDSSKRSAHDNEVGDCSQCNKKQCTYYQRSSGLRVCHECGNSVLDNLSYDWQDASFNERKEINTDNGVHEYIEDRDEEDENVTSEVIQDSGANQGASKYKYECRSYLSYRLASVQCREHAKIAPEDLQKIYDTLYKHRLYNGVNGWNTKQMKAFLKLCGLPKLYKHVSYLLNFMSMKLPLKIDKEVEQLFMDAFDRIEPVLNKYKQMLSDHRSVNRSSRPHCK